LAFLLFGFDLGLHLHFGLGSDLTFVLHLHSDLGSDLAFGFVSTTGSTCKGFRQDLQFP